ncbi:glycoside hydrolase domain-containing protein [Streptomyces sp. NPDC002574]|uniref:glycoside hydrolase domain-containing protein n=1 Tax=Streptomyces sp. NPDC002574 TaxID=3364652 RepID=UPI0036A85C10
MSGHRMSKKRRYIAWAVAGVAVLAGAGIAAEASMATTVSRPAPKVYTGRAFDTCTAPSASAMKAWKATNFYGAAAVYVGGKNRGCAQPNLTASWVKTVSASGWKLIPLYVGAQPPCQTSRNPEKLTAGTAASLGATDGADAVAKASALGMKAGSTLYLDMESYDTTNTACTTAVLTYIRAWDKAVHAKNYWAGFYGFKSSSAAAVAQAKDRTDLPDALWYALWDQNKTTTADWPFSTALWTGHRRGHQYMVNSKETRGGWTLTVDRDDWDAPVAVTG